MKIKYDISLINFIRVFENKTRCPVKDCFAEESSLVFIVPETHAGKAIGKGGANVRELERVFKRKIKIVAFNPRVHAFISNVIYPLRAKEIREEGDVITIVGADTAEKGVLIGRNGRNLRNLTEITKRHFPISKIEVI